MSDHPSVDHPSAGHQAQDEQTVRRLRLGIGVLGLLLPIVLPVGNSLTSSRIALLSSMSASYYSHMRNVFVGGLCAIGVFLICYRHDRREDRLSSVAGVLAILVALFPAEPPASVTPHPTTAQTIIGTFHLCFAAGLFGVLAYFCLQLFADSPSTGGRRPARDWVYLVCGWVIVACVVVVAAGAVLHLAWDSPLTLMYAGEAVSVLAFGVAWLVKSEAVVTLVPRPAPDTAT
ncbi:DUF998 domain-containing protein [Kitasatospora sp. RG8]|uniref:DUF998 domain-containing protein n=1 Tax=Kitasatospora sp. RG8 TaxID=2820815 RepID=UPI001ADEFDAF|nr:DUF998 domain-containing protein [Kitasatospora sp. RG8]MBP0452674.1 DUF998 domain-containing protein [Kitasatospora sp. RG8]